MEELELKEFELNFLQLMGINYVDGKFVDVKDNSEFTFDATGTQDLEDGESMTTYTFNNSATTIRLHRWNYLNGKANNTNIIRNGYNYGVENSAFANAIYAYIEYLGKDRLASSGIYMEQTNDKPLISTAIDEAISGVVKEKLKMLCSKDKIYIGASFRGNSVINRGYGVDYTEDNYTTLLKAEIIKLKDAEHRNFFMKILPMLVKTHESMQIDLEKDNSKRKALK
jgi:hypothetical protein